MQRHPHEVRQYGTSLSRTVHWQRGSFSLPFFRNQKYMFPSPGVRHVCCPDVHTTAVRQNVQGSEHLLENAPVPSLKLPESPACAFHPQNT